MMRFPHHPVAMPRAFWWRCAIRVITAVSIEDKTITLTELSRRVNDEGAEALARNVAFHFWYVDIAAWWRNTIPSQFICQLRRRLGCSVLSRDLQSHASHETISALSPRWISPAQGAWQVQEARGTSTSTAFHHLTLGGCPKSSVEVLNSHWSNPRRCNPQSWNGTSYFNGIRDILNNSP